MNRRVLAFGLAFAASVAPLGCMSTPPPKLPAVDLIPERQKMAWILQLEDQRLLKFDLPAPPPPPPPIKGKKPVALPPPPKPSSSPDLAVLVRDADPRLRRRAALAIGRVKDRAGVALLVPVLADTDPDVRAMAAFALGLIGDPSAEASLTALLTDTVPLVRGRAAEALGLVGAKGSAAAIGRMVAEYAKHSAVASMAPDDETLPIAPEAEAFRLGLFALVRLSAYEPLAAAVLNGSQPVSTWWPIAYALQRVDDTRAVPALLTLLNTNTRYTRAFAARGLGRAKDPSAIKPLVALLPSSAKSGLEVTVGAIRALAQLGATDAVGPLTELIADPNTHANVRLEAVTALGEIRAPEGLPYLQDLMHDDWPTMRAAAMRAAAAVDPDSFVAVFAGLPPDRHWRVRAAAAEVLGNLPADLVIDRVRSMLQDEDKRVIPAVLSAMAKLKVPDLRALLLERLNDSDFAVRATAARELGTLKPEGGAEALRAAYKNGLKDQDFDARTAALTALAAYGRAEAESTLRDALTDKDWAVRLRAEDLLAKAAPNDGASPAIAPAPTNPSLQYDDPQLVGPTTSPHVFIETSYGTIEFELAVLDAPLTSRNFVDLVRRNFFNGVELHRVIANFVVQDGDPRGDGEGGPGYSIRDELNDRPYLRGTVGMALAGRDTGGSQFFITHSPQPHLDAKYTVFGYVVNGIEILDRLKPGDVILRIRVWDGTGWIPK